MPKKRWSKVKDLVPFKWRGNHHSYHGAWLVAFGIFQWYMGIDNGELESLIPFWQGLIGVGALMVIDDIIEHTITADTPLRILYEKIIMPILLKRLKK